MANPQHIEWLLEGVEAWNARVENREIGLPDFSGADIYLAFRAAGKIDHNARIPLIGANLMGADFTGANLYLADLTDANLKGANFNGADLIEADLTNAWLIDATLKDAVCCDAYLNGAYLNDTDLNDTDLSGANLGLTDVTDAVFKDVNLAGALLAATEPWKAILYPESNPSPEQYDGDIVQVNAVEDFLRQIRTIREHHATYGEEIVLYFRGEAECGWDLLPSVARDDYLESESRMLPALVSRHPAEFADLPSALSQWVMARHHGLRTRFLDITKNPLVALFNACEKEYKNDGRLHMFAVPISLIHPFNSDIVSVVANFARLSQYDQWLILGKRESHHGELYNDDRNFKAAMRRLLQLIREEKPYFEEQFDYRDLYRVFVVEPQQSSDRLRAQAGAFLVSAFHERFERDAIEEQVKGVPVYAHYTLIVPNESKASIIEDLRLLNISHETLFPGLDSSAAAITERYRQQGSA